MDAVKQKLSDIISGPSLNFMDDAAKPTNPRLSNLLDCLTVMVEDTHFIYNASVVLGANSDAIDNM